MDLLRNPNPYKCMGPEGKHLSLLNDVIVVSHTIIFERSWISKILGNLRKVNAPSVLERKIISSKDCFLEHGGEGDLE